MALTVPERQELTKKAEDAKLAQQALFQSHLRRVVTIARKYEGTGLPLLELIQAGNPALVHTAERFDVSRASSSQPARDVVDTPRHYSTRRQLSAKRRMGQRPSASGYTEDRAGDFVTAPRWSCASRAPSSTLPWARAAWSAASLQKQAPRGFPLSVCG